MELGKWEIENESKMRMGIVAGILKKKRYHEVKHVKL